MINKKCTCRCKCKEILASSNNTQEECTSDNKLHLLYGIVFFVLISALLLLVNTIENTLPHPLETSDEIKFPDKFITENALKNLELLTKIEARVTGQTENEILAIEFLRNKIETIIEQADENQNIQQDLQLVSGVFNYTNDDTKVIKSYSNIQNIVVKIRGRGETRPSILINSRFDSYINGPGASSDGVMVVTMLETLRKLSQRKERPLHNIIFLFNGAAEDGWLGVHGFITKHKWAMVCNVVINLHSIGNSGKSMLFQIGPRRPWLVKYYQKVPQPCGQLFDEEIFQTLISDGTDFRMIRDYGRLPGEDLTDIQIADWQVNVIYYFRIPKGSIQHMGDNLLTLITELGEAPELYEKFLRNDSIVYYDFLGLFMVFYTNLAGTMLNFFAVVTSVAIFIFSMTDYNFDFTIDEVMTVSTTFIALFMGRIVALVFCALTAITLDLFNVTMRWYTNSWLILLVYCIPTIVITSVFPQMIKNQNWSLNVQVQIQAHCDRLIYTTLLLLGAMVNFQSVYLILVPILFNSVAFILIHSLRWHKNGRKWLVVYVISLIIPTIFLMQNAIRSIDLLVPLSGRLGAHINPEFLIMLTAVTYTFLITTPFTVLINLVRNSSYILYVLVAIFMVGLILICTPLGFPYRISCTTFTPQRYEIYHSRINIHKDNKSRHEDFGYYVKNMDRNSLCAVFKNIDMSKTKYIEDYSKNFKKKFVPFMYSGMFLPAERRDFWIPANKPSPTQKPILTLHSKKHLSSEIVTYNFTALGGDKKIIWIAPEIEMTFISITISNSKSKPIKINFKDKKIKFVVLHGVHGRRESPLNFQLDVVVPDANEKSIKIALTGLYFYNEETVRSAEFQYFIDSFPKWTDVSSLLTTYESWIM